MNTTSLNKEINNVGTFRVKGEDFIILKKKYIDEFSILVKSVVSGEKTLRAGKTRSFNDFVKVHSKKRK